MSTAFDPYHRWLSIRPEDQPADHYRLLNVSRFEDDPEVIQDAAERQIAHVRRYALGQHQAISQKILNELAAAKACLLNPERKRLYDATLRQTEPAAVESGQAPAAVVLDRTEFEHSGVPDPPATSEPPAAAEWRAEAAADVFSASVPVDSHFRAASDRSRSGVLRPRPKTSLPTGVLVGAFAAAVCLLLVAALWWSNSTSRDAKQRQTAEAAAIVDHRSKEEPKSVASSRSLSPENPEGSQTAQPPVAIAPFDAARAKTHRDEEAKPVVSAEAPAPSAGQAAEATGVATSRADVGGDRYGFNYLMLEAYQAGSTAEIDNLRVTDLQQNQSLVAFDFGDEGIDGLILRQRRDSNTPWIVNGPMTKVANGRLRLECTGFRRNGAGGYNSSAQMILRRPLPSDFSIEFVVKRLQWSGHFYFVVCVDEQMTIPTFKFTISGHELMPPTLHIPHMRKLSTAAKGSYHERDVHVRLMKSERRLELDVDEKRCATVNDLVPVGQEVSNARNHTPAPAQDAKRAVDLADSTLVETASAKRTSEENRGTIAKNSKRLSLDGEWVLVEGWNQGTKMTGARWANCRIIFSGTQYTKLAGGMVIEGRIGIDTTKSPMHLDWIPLKGGTARYRGKVTPGIFEMSEDGTTLRFCAAGELEAPRPIDFDPKASGVTVQVYRKLR